MNVTFDVIIKLLQIAESNYDFLTKDDIEFYVPGSTNDSDYYSNLIYILENKLGILTFKDENEVLNLYKIFAEQGEARYQYLVAKIYYQGLITEKNPELSIKWVGEAISNDFHEARVLRSEMFFLNNLIPGGMADLTIAAEKGSSKAQCLLADIYAFGLYGLNVDLDKARYACTEAMKQRAPQSYFISAKLCAIGDGENGEYDQILPLMRKAAEHGVLEAQAILFSVLMEQEGESAFEKQFNYPIKRQLNLFESLAWAEIVSKSSLNGDFAATDFVNEQIKILKNKLSETELKQSNLIRDDLIKKIEANVNHKYLERLTGLDLKSILS